MEAEWFKNPKWWFGCDSSVDMYLTEKYGHLLCEDIRSYSDIDKILIYDQLPRHMYRNEQAHHVICYYLQKALAVHINYDDLTDEQLCFALLPLRHSKIPNNCFKVMRIAWERLKNTKSPTMLQFIKACYEKCTLVGAFPTAPCKGFDESVLYFKPSQPPSVPDFFLNMSMIQTRKIILSISGGVDSMVCSWILVNKYAPENIIAVHINYNNRTTSDEEEKFVRYWCGVLQIQCFVRKIHEIQREQCMEHGLRDTYETYTRNVRYHCYKQFGKHSVVVLGHNKDDVVENIFTNIADKTKYDNLDGMSEYSTSDDIVFWRPLLNKSKHDIVSFAHEHHIPYLPNSTPDWSMRGNIRSTVIPCLNKWNKEFVPSLHELSRNMSDLYKIMTIYIDDMIHIKSYDENMMVFKIPKVPTSSIFWRCLLAKYNIVPSTKSIKHLCERLENWDKKQKLIVVLTKNLRVAVNKKYVYLIKQIPNT